MNDAGFRNDDDKPVALALVRTYDDLERRRVQKSAAPQVDDQEPVGAQIRFGALNSGFKSFCVGDIELAEDVQCDDRIKILADKSRAVIGNIVPTFRPSVWLVSEQDTSCDPKRDAA